MRTGLKLENDNQHQIPVPLQQFEKRKSAFRQFSSREGTTSTAKLKARLTRLVHEHRDLDNAIEKLGRVSSCDPLIVTSLKRRKLNLKDEISRIEMHCTSGFP